MPTFSDSDTPYIIAEVGGNHGGDFEVAKKYLKKAAETGVDAVKFQMYRAENLIIEDQPALPLAGDEYDSQYNRFKELELTNSQWNQLADLAQEEGVDFAASVFDREMAELASDLSPFIKIASGDLTNIPLLRRVNEMGEPVVLSTGFSTIDEIRRAVTELSEVDLTLLHCVGSYPTPESEAHLEMIDVLSDEFGCSVGYSDHTIGTEVPVAAVARGSVVIEKHFTLDKNKDVGDHRLSAEPSEMREIVERSQQVSSMFGNATRDGRLTVEDEIREDMRRSLAVSEQISAGETLTEDILIGLRPSTGIPATRIDEIMGQEATRDIQPKKILTEEDISGSSMKD